jgi:hypothetical protein
MTYLADPGGVFASDTHRRTLGHLTADPMTVEDLFHRMRPDVGTDHADTTEVEAVLADLEADGYVEQTDGGWRMTAMGLDALNAEVVING